MSHGIENRFITDQQMNILKNLAVVTKTGILESGFLQQSILASSNATDRFDQENVADLVIILILLLLVATRIVIASRITALLLKLGLRLPWISVFIVGNFSDYGYCLSNCLL